MARLLRMPEIAANAVEAVLAEWPVAENASFHALDAIATIETEKAVVDVPADADGVILRHLVQAGAEVSVGEPIALLGDMGETADDIDALLARLGVAPGRTPAAAATEPDPIVISVGAPSPIPAVAPPSSTGTRVFSSPLARRLASDAGLGLPEIVGTGPGGRVVRRDVERAIEVRGTAVAEPAPAPVLPTGAEEPAYEDIPHSRMRRAIATRLSESTREAPHFYLAGTARVDRLLKLRARLNAHGDTKISVNDLVVMAAARAHVLVPAMNVSWLPDAVRSYSTIDVAVAVATDKGLVTPVVRGADRLTASALASATRDLVDRARSGRLREEELSGGSLTITNLGGFGTESFAAILNPPQAAILAVGAARQEPVVRKGRVAVGTVMHLTLSVDHRPVDGVVAAQWMAALLGLLENPLRLLM